MDIKTLLQSQESNCLEFKQQCPKASVLAEILCSFANGSGGDLIIGVEDGTKALLGIDDQEIIAAEELIANASATLIAPIIAPIIKSARIKGKNLIFVHVDSGYQKPYLAKSGRKQMCYIRIGSTTREADTASINMMRLEAKGISWDSLPFTELKLSQLDNELIHEYLDLRFQVRGINPPKAISDSWLKKARFAAEKGNVLYPTNAAVLLFSQEAPFLFPQSGIECARFKGTNSREFIDKKTINGPLFQLPEKVLAFAKTNLPIAAAIKGIVRSEMMVYPEIALREFAINAICHRIYAHPSSTTKIAIFDDIIEITNSGSLHQGLELEDLGTGISLLRNTTLARVFSEVGLIEGWGTGIQEAQKALAECKLPGAVFREKGPFFQVSSNWRWPADLAPRELEILQLIAKKNQIESKDIAGLYSITDRGARKVLTQLCKKKLLEKIGTTKSTVYRLSAFS